MTRRGEHSSVLMAWMTVNVQNFTQWLLVCVRGRVLRAHRLSVGDRIVKTYNEYHYGCDYFEYSLSRVVVDIAASTWNDDRYIRIAIAHPGGMLSRTERHNWHTLHRNERLYVLKGSKPDQVLAALSR